MSGLEDAVYKEAVCLRTVLVHRDEDDEKEEMMSDKSGIEGAVNDGTSDWIRIPCHLFPYLIGGDCEVTMPAPLDTSRNFLQGQTGVPYQTRLPGVIGLGEHHYQDDDTVSVRLFYSHGAARLSENQIVGALSSWKEAMKARYQTDDFDATVNAFLDLFNGGNAHVENQTRFQPFPFRLAFNAGKDGSEIRTTVERVYDFLSISIDGGLCRVDGDGQHIPCGSHGFKYHTLTQIMSELKFYPFIPDFTRISVQKHLRASGSPYGTAMERTVVMIDLISIAQGAEVSGISFRKAMSNVLTAFHNFSKTIENALDDLSYIRTSLVLGDGPVKSHMAVYLREDNSDQEALEIILDAATALWRDDMLAHPVHIENWVDPNAPPQKENAEYRKPYLRVENQEMWLFRIALLASIFDSLSSPLFRQSDDYSSPKRLLNMISESVLRHIPFRNRSEADRIFRELAIGVISRLPVSSARVNLIRRVKLPAGVIRNNEPSEDTKLADKAVDIFLGVARAVAALIDAGGLPYFPGETASYAAYVLKFIDVDEIFKLRAMLDARSMTSHRFDITLVIQRLPGEEDTPTQEEIDRGQRGEDAHSWRRSKAARKLETATSLAGMRREHYQAAALQLVGPLKAMIDMGY